VGELKESEERRAHKEESNQIPQEPSKNKNPIGYVRETKAVLPLNTPRPRPPTHFRLSTNFWMDGSAGWIKTAQ
jgi:hypothetical protein